MTGKLVPTQVGDVQVLVETLPPVAGSEPTAGRIEDASRKVVEAFDKAQDAIVEIASKVAGSVAAMGDGRWTRTRCRWSLGFRSRSRVIW
jgi:hypothetical protein